MTECPFFQSWEGQVAHIIERRQHVDGGTSCFKHTRFIAYYFPFFLHITFAVAGIYIAVAAEFDYVVLVLIALMCNFFIEKRTAIGFQHGGVECVAQFIKTVGPRLGGRRELCGKTAAGSTSRPYVGIACGFVDQSPFVQDLIPQIFVLETAGKDTCGRGCHKNSEQTRNRRIVMSDE